MAEKERQTKKERRDEARADRKRKEAEKARQARKQRLVTTLTGALVVVAIGAVVFSAVGGGGGGEIEDAILVSTQAAEDARSEAGCEVVDDTPLESRQHFQSQAAPPADQVYTGVRPTHSGPHLEGTHPVVNGAADNQLAEIATTHNLEHGAVIAWFDPEQVDGATVSEMGAWGERLNNSGFAGDAGSMGAGAAVFVSPYTDPGIASGKAVAFRGWGIAMDCDEWNETVANSFVIDHYGTHGTAPEASSFAPYPEGVLTYGDPESGETQQPTQDPSPGATTPAGDASPTATSEPSPDAGS